MGGSKATVRLQGKPLISYPLEAMRTALEQVAVIAKPDTELPSLPGVEVWLEPQGPHHPLLGVVRALQLAGGRPVLACAADLPFVTSPVINELARASPGSGLATIACHRGRTQPLLGSYQPAAIDPLDRAARRGEAIREAVAALEPLIVEVDDPDALFNVNSREDLAAAEAILKRRAASRR
jgi:molybdopterin-guanine dinucleotide biosynthesis protein A